MKRTTFVVALMGLVAVFLAYGCGGNPPAQQTEDPMVDTTTPPPPPPVTETKPTEPEVRRISESEFRTVYFDFDKSAIKPEYRADLEHNASLMKENMDMLIKIEGHCDERGTVEYNIALGERRAMAVKNYMINLGVAAGRIDIVSYGKERPAMMGHNEAAWSKNRRAEFRIVSQ